MKTLDILNCAASGDVSFSFQCPVGWDSLNTTGDPRRRHCATCQRAVFLCHDANEAGLRAEQGECIAVPGWLVKVVREHDTPNRLFIGQSQTITELLEEIVQGRVG